MNQPADLPRAGEEETRAFLDRQKIEVGNEDALDLARVLLADDGGGGVKPPGG